MAHVNSGISYGIDSSLDVMTVRFADDSASSDSVMISLRPMVDSLLTEYGEVPADGIPVERMSIDTVTAAMKLKVVLLRVNVRRVRDTLKPTAYDALILYSTAQQQPLD